MPFVDVLTTMLDDSLPLTPGEWPEWGNPITDPAAFALIRSYSPYDNVAAQAYPPMLITGGLNDPRVTYWEPAKWVAKLRATRTDDRPLLLKINMGAGHGGKSGRWEFAARGGRGVGLRADAARLTGCERIGNRASMRASIRPTLAPTPRRPSPAISTG